MSRVSLQPASTPDVEVEIGDALFTPQIVTRTRARQINELDREFAAVQRRHQDAESGESADDLVDEMVRLIGCLLDVWLAPEPGKRKKPSAAIKAMWEGEQVTFAQLLGLLESITEATGRPT